MVLPGSQPLDPRFNKKYNLPEIDEHRPEPVIVSQRIGKLFDDLDIRRKPGLKIRLRRKWRRVKNLGRDINRGIRNHMRWHKTLCELYPFEGYSGLLRVMITHLNDYLRYEEKYGYSEKEFKAGKITAVEETLGVLARMQEPDEYISRRIHEVKVRYPQYKGLITKYADGGTGDSGMFVQQGAGWAGEEAGNDPRRGYFEFAGGRFELAASPDQAETDRLLAELDKYGHEIHDAYKQAEADSNADIDRLAQLLKESLYSWWD